MNDGKDTSLPSPFSFPVAMNTLNVPVVGRSPRSSLCPAAHSSGLGGRSPPSHTPLALAQPARPDLGHTSPGREGSGSLGNVPEGTFSKAREGKKTTLSPGWARL